MTKLQGYATKYPYAVLGAGDLLVERAKELGRTSAKLATGMYGELVNRGERVATGIKKSQPGKRLAENAKQAQRQLKGAATSVRKALGNEPSGATNTKSTKKAG